MSLRHVEKSSGILKRYFQPLHPVSIIMPRFFFDIQIGPIFKRDSIGTEFTTMESIRGEALRTLPAMASDRISHGGEQQAFTVLVRNADAKTIYTATLTFAGVWIGNCPIPNTEDDPLRDNPDGSTKSNQCGKDHL